MHASTQGTSVALLFYSFGLCAYSGIKIIAPAFYSLQDTKTPAKIGIYSMILNIILNLVLMGPLKHGGLALATSLSALFNVIVLIHYLRKRLGLLGGKEILNSSIKMSIAAGVMGVMTYISKELWFKFDDPIEIRIVILLACISIGMLVYALVSHMLKNKEWQFLLNLKKQGNRITDY